MDQSRDSQESAWEVTFHRLGGLAREQAGLAVRPDHRFLIEARLLGPARRLGLDIHDLVAVACRHRHPPLVQAVIEALTTHTTAFFRERHHFEALLEHGVRPRLHGGLGQPYRVWSAACSTGEEPYSLALLLRRTQKKYPGLDFRILATDLSEAVLRTAQEGRYEAAHLEPVPPPLRAEGFVSLEGGRVQVHPEVRRAVTFRRLNLVQTPYRTAVRMDAILCRNALIYFERNTQVQVVRHLVERLELGGLLMLGHTERVDPRSFGLRALGPTTYQRTE